VKEITRRNRKTGKDVIHYVFDNTSEAIIYLTGELLHLNMLNQDLSNPLNAFRHWQDGAKFEWVKCDDGCITQIMNRWDWVYDKYKDSEIYRTKSAVKVVFGVYYKSSKKDGTYTMERMIGLPKTINDISLQPSTIGGNYTVAGKYLTKDKKLFAYYCAVTGNPFKAWMIVKKTELTGSFRSMRAVYTQAVDLMKDAYVLKEIKHYIPMDEFKEKWKKALAKENIDIDRLAKSLNKGLTSAEVVKPGSMNHKFFFEMSVNILRWSEDTSGKIAIDGSEKPKPENLGNMGVEQIPENTVEVNTSFSQIPPPRNEIKDMVDANVIEYVDDTNKESIKSAAKIEYEKLKEQFIKKNTAQPKPNGME